MNYKDTDLYLTSRENFYNFIIDKNYKVVDGGVSHSEYYLDENNKAVAYIQSSSWGAETIYKTIEGDCNFETLNFVDNLIKNINRR